MSLKRAVAMIEADRESSIRHWTQVREAAIVRAGDLGWSARTREQAKRDIDRADRALAMLARGETPSIWGE